MASVGICECRNEKRGDGDFEKLANERVVLARRQQWRGTDEVKVKMKMKMS